MWTATKGNGGRGSPIRDDPGLGCGSAGVASPQHHLVSNSRDFAGLGRRWRWWRWRGGRRWRSRRRGAWGAAVGCIEVEIVKLHQVVAACPHNAPPPCSGGADIIEQGDTVNTAICHTRVDAEPKSVPRTGLQLKRQDAARQLGVSWNRANGVYAAGCVKRGVCGAYVQKESRTRRESLEVGTHKC